MSVRISRPFESIIILPLDLFTENYKVTWLGSRDWLNLEWGYWWLKVGSRAENLYKPAKSTRFWWQYAFMNWKSARPWEYDKAVSPLTEFVCNPNFLELQMTSSEVKPLENKSRTVNIVAGHAAKSDDSIMSVGKTAFLSLTKSKTSSNIDDWKECCWNRDSHSVILFFNHLNSIQNKSTKFL